MRRALAVWVMLVLEVDDVRAGPRMGEICVEERDGVAVSSEVRCDDVCDGGRRMGGRGVDVDITSLLLLRLEDGLGVQDRDWSLFRPTTTSTYLPLIIIHLIKASTQSTHSCRRCMPLGIKSC